MNSNEIQNKSNTKNTITYEDVCPRCNHYLVIELVFNKREEVSLSCDCGYKVLININQFISHFNHNPNLNNNCIQHNKEVFKYYCLNCKVHLCCKCEKWKHNSHQLISLNNYLNLSIIEDKIQKAYAHITTYFSSLHQSFITDLQTQINRIQFAYQESERRNKDLLTFTEELLKSYSQNSPNYFLEKNLINSSNIHIYEYNTVVLEKISKTNIEKVIKYFNSYSIIQEREKEIALSSFQEINSINLHKNEVSFILLLKDGRLASCSIDNTIKVYNNINFNCEITVLGHKEGISCLAQINATKLVSSSLEEIKIWNINEISLQCTHTILKAHDDFIWKIISLSKERIASCSSDKTVKIWNSNEPYNLITTLQGHYSEVRSIIQLKNKEYLLSGSIDISLRLWNLITYQTETIINNIYCSYTNSLLEIESGKIIIGGFEIINIMNSKTFQIEQSIHCENVGWILSLVEIKDGTILCGSSKGKFCLYNIKLNSIQINKCSHKANINCIIKTNDDCVISGSVDSKIKKWKYD